MKEKKEYIYSTQSALFGNPECIGFGSISFYIKEIDRKKSIQYIKKNHYSGKVTSNSFIHLGVFYKDDLMGVLQFGPAMNPASCSSVVEGTQQDQYLELNRMHLLDNDLKYAESQAVSMCISYIKKKYPKIKWIQSFADERCGGFGIVYQACSFNYYGEHTSTFWVLDGVWYHNKAMTIRDESKISPSERYLQKNRERATSHRLRQFRYIKFIDNKWKKKCLLEEKKYPKHYEDLS